MLKTIHLVSVILFLLIYLVKTILLLANKKETLLSVTKMLKVPEMAISLIFLITGIYLLVELPVINSFMIIKLVMVFASIPLAIVGFKKENKVLATLALLLIIGSYGLAEVSHKKSINTEVSSNVTNGKTLYEQKCVICHGTDGRLGSNGSKDLSATAMDQTGILEIIKNGKGAMPPSGLTDEQVMAVADYVATLKK